MKREHVEAWAARLSRFPVTLVLANLADLKRRNDQLGHAAVDEDIAAFEQAVAARGLVHARVGGDEWLVAVPGDPAPVVEAIVAAYARVEARRVGWRCVAIRAGERRETVETVATTLRRAARFLAHPVEDADAAIGAALWLADEIAGLPLDSCHFSAAVKTWPRQRWDSVGAYPRDPYCPFCGGERFTWEDGGTGSYDASGRCQGCDAEIDLRDAGGAG